ncbi:GrpB-like predicted nucleotidyltransferase (UPF0157 family) [Wenyingzhuangia heitensis]|uniref:GrpB-like predicted nucleotidyltransferase (UPF0157 family) n=1 Tax=Wenyingzhuangia heitensis TaxID=1487859 RepID=A0ABX0UGY4_9FLAO|nr:GrpB family protein [Wenyingzhuangia heitensis]NIJ46646.1 GrpB-like predicted nucleotidyltransferase (UPF0157 family) [Wenyingzhuangia heitensis]
MIREKIIVQNYNPEWEQMFKSLEKALTKNLQDEIIRIEHVGSTSVKGMKAKPIIDLDIIIKDNEKTLKSVIEKLETLGYIHLGEMGIAGREAFKRTDLKTPITNPERKWFEHNLYLCKEESIGLKNHLALKKHLLENPLKVIEYSNLKEKLAEKFSDDIDRYVDGKTDFILSILKEEGIKNSESKLIETQNKIQNN